MTHVPTDPDPNGNAEGTPRWVYPVWPLVLVVLIAFVVAILIGGNHGPGQHGF